MAPRSRSYRLGHWRRGAVISNYYAQQIPPFPQLGVVADLDFIGRQYFWNGAMRREADFTSLVLNGATWTAQGLDLSTCSANPDIRITLAALGITLPPCVFALAGYWPTAPAATKVVMQFDDGTDANRIMMSVVTTPNLNMQITDATVQQSSQNPGSIQPGAARWGVSFSAALNDVKASGNGSVTGSPADTAATIPTVTTLRLGCRALTAGTFPPAVLSRLWIYTAVKTQAELNLLSVQIRDAPAATVPQAETLALTAAMTVQPTAARRNLIDQTIASLKSAGLWTRLDFLHVLAAHDGQAARINWINPAQVLTANGGATFAVDSGWSGNGVDGWLGAGINWSALTRFTQDDASIGVWVQNTVPSGSVLGSTINNRITLNVYSGSGAMSCRLNNATASSDVVSSGRGHSLATRSSAASYDCYRNAALLTTAAIASVAVIAEPIVFLRAVNNYTQDQILGAAHAGASLTPAQISSLYSILNTWMVGVGA